MVDSWSDERNLKQWWAHQPTVQTCPPWSGFTYWHVLYCCDFGVPQNQQRPHKRFEMFQPDKLEMADHFSGQQYQLPLVLPRFGSEPRFEPEPGRTEPKFSSRFKAPAEPNLRFSSRFSWTLDFLNQFELVRTRFEPHLGWSRIPGPNSPLGYSRVPN
jgi:hypothetical protein